MSYCYLCGKPIPNTQRHVRRKVKTGEHETKAYFGGKAKSVKTYYGLRLVCRACANRLDRGNLRRELLYHLGPLALLLALFLFSQALRQ